MLYLKQKNTSLFSLVLYQLSQIMAWRHTDVGKISNIPRLHKCLVGYSMKMTLSTECSTGELMIFLILLTLYYFHLKGSNRMLHCYKTPSPTKHGYQ